MNNQEAFYFSWSLLLVIIFFSIMLGCKSAGYITNRHIKKIHNTDKIIKISSSIYAVLTSLVFIGNLTSYGEINNSALLSFIALLVINFIYYFFTKKYIISNNQDIYRGNIEIKKPNKKKRKNIIVALVAIVIIVIIFLFIRSILIEFSTIKNNQKMFLEEKHSTEEKYNFCNKQKYLRDECFFEIINHFSENENNNLSFDDSIICSSISATNLKNKCEIFISKYEPFTPDSYQFRDNNLEITKLRNIPHNSSQETGPLADGNLFIVSGKMAKYRDINLLDDIDSLVVYAEEFTSKDYSKAIEYIVVKTNEELSSERDENKTQKLNYLDHEIYFTNNSGVSGYGEEDSETAGIGSILFPEYNIIVTVYFYNTPYYGVDLISFEDFMKKVTYNIVDSKH